MEEIKLAILDMIGTTVDATKALETCYFNAALKTGLKVDRSVIRKHIGLQPEKVIRNLWQTKMDPKNEKFEPSVAATTHLFRAVLENHFVLNGAKPMKGALDTFKWLRAQGVYIVLTTNLYRKVSRNIMKNLEWEVGLDENSKSNEIAIIDLALTPEDVDGKGFPDTAMIKAAMEKLEVKNSKEVILVGDTPTDLEAGKAAGCLLSMAVSNGAASPEELAAADNDGVIEHIGLLSEALAERLEKVSA